MPSGKSFTIKIRGMMRLFLAVAVLAIICAIDPLRFATFEHVAAQAPAQSIGNEPHHKRLLYTNDLRLWDVTVPPGQSTSPYVHEYDVATILIGEGTLNIQRNGEQ